MDDTSIKFIRAKFHRLYVIDANLSYHGYITLDLEHSKLLGSSPLKCLEIWNKNDLSK